MSSFFCNAPRPKRAFDLVNHSLESPFFPFKPDPVPPIPQDPNDASPQPPQIPLFGTSSQQRTEGEEVTFNCSWGTSIDANPFANAAPNFIRLSAPEKKMASGLFFQFAAASFPILIIEPLNA